MEQEWCLMNGIVLQKCLLKERLMQVRTRGADYGLDQIVACTEDCFQTMFISYAPGVFTISSLMKAFRNILMILNTKPKFQVLRDNPRFVPIMRWLQQCIIPQLVVGAKNDRVRNDT